MWKMYFKLVIRNMKRCFGDYLVYLMTLFLAVAIFYIFNAIPFNESIQSSSKEIKESMPIVIDVLSIFICVIMSLLIIYANSFIIKRRSKELGVYMILGMSSLKVSIMLFVEMLVLAGTALLAGLFAGIFLSQGISFIVARIFEQELETLKFFISISALFKTVLYFFLIFIIVALFISCKIVRLKIINLVHKNRRNEKIRLAKKSVSIILIVCSVLFLVAAYIIALDKDFRFNDIKKVVTVFILGSVGTYLFYFSASGFLLTVLMRCKSLYYKDLNIFSIRQVSNKIMSNTVMIATISIMLLVTICAFAGGFGLNDFANSKLKRVAPNDFQFPIEANTSVVPLGKYIKSQGYDKYSIIATEVYPSDITLSNTVLKSALEEASKKNKNAYSNLLRLKLNFIKLTDYNNMRRQKGLDAISLNTGTIALHVIEAELKSYIKEFVNMNKALNVSNTLKIAGIYDENLIAGYLEFAVINDEELNGVIPSKKVVIVNINNKYNQTFYEKVQNEISKYSIGKSIVRFEILQKLYGMSALAIFAGLYIGITFLIMSTTILALQLLIDTTQHKQRYKTLIQIGSDNKMIEKSLVLQMVVYFFAPLILTVVNSIVALTAVANYIQLAGNFSILRMVLFTGIVFIVFYGLYFTISRYGYKRILEGVFWQ